MAMDERVSFPIGTRIGDDRRYELREPIGKGGMAEVYRAVDTRLNNRIVAVKALSATIEAHALKDRIRTLFIEEARALSRIKDDNVIAVLDSGTTPDGTPFMVMEFLNGQDLGQLLKKEKVLPVERAVDIILAVCAGIHACHLAGIIHRDLKPANIFLDLTLKGEQPKVLDFSVAKIPIGREAGEKEATLTDFIVGTPTYMSPEQLAGKSANELSDQYSIGALLYRCLTGRPPQGLFPPPCRGRPDFPQALEDAILRALQSDPVARFGSVFELGRAIEAHASVAGRGRWKPYYMTPPVPLQPAFTGPINTLQIGVARQPASSDPAAATSVASYDFAIHERTTQLNGLAQNATDTAATTVDPIGPSIDAPHDQVPTDTLPPPADLGDHASSPFSLKEVRGGHSNASGSSISSVRPSTIQALRARLQDRSARRMVLASALSLAVIISGAILGARAWRDRDPPPSPAPPGWTRSPEELAPPATLAKPAAAAGEQSPAVAPDEPPSPSTPTTTAGPAVQEPPPPSAELERPTKKRKPRVNRPIQYTRDGVPLLPAN
jgi:serine/threonine protein kinase